MAAMRATHARARGRSGQVAGSLGLRPVNWDAIRRCRAARSNLGGAAVVAMVRQVLFAGAAAAAEAEAAGATPGADAADAAAFCTSLDRSRRTFMLKLATRRWSRGLSATLPATISTSSGRVSHGLLLLRLRSNSETRSFDCAVPTRVTTWLSCFRLLM